MKIALFTFSLVISTTGIIAQTFLPSVNVYRIPYVDGTEIEITRDHWSHDPPGRIDAEAVDGSPFIVAAADGVIEWIEDSNTESCTGDPCACAPFNNYVWVSHVNGEWTKYTHFVTGSVTSLGHEVGDAVSAGMILGTEGDVGCASGIHLHFEVAYPEIFDDVTGLPFVEAGGFLLPGNENRIPVICGIPGNLFIEGDNYVAAPCASDCATIGIFNFALLSGNIDIMMVDDLIITNGSPILFPGSSAMFRAGDEIIFGPGFKGLSGSRFIAQIKSCNDN